MAAALLGVFIWIIAYRKLPFTDILKLIAGGLIAIFISIGIDSWFYEKLVFTPWNYFYFQLILGKAANFGTDPWWHYFNLFFANAAPPISIFLFVFFVIGAIKNKHSAIVYIIVPFVIMHMGIGHKEMRFMFPIFPLFLVIVSLGYDNLVSRGKVSKPLLIALKATFVINILLIVFRTFSPAQELVSYYRFLNDISSDKNYLLIAIDNDPYSYAGLPVNFYRSPNIETQHFSSYNLAEEYINNYSEKPILILHNELMLGYEFSDFNKKRIYSILPDWISNFNINDWQSRANLYSIYSLEKTPVVKK